MTEFLLKLHAQGPGHEAVIEIMIALLGLMLTVFALMIALFEFFGYSAIKEEAVRQAVKQAESQAVQFAADELKRFLNQEQGADLAVSQATQTERRRQGANPTPAPVLKAEPVKKPRKQKAVSDKNLQRGDET